MVMLNSAIRFRELPVHHCCARRNAGSFDVGKTARECYCNVMTKLLVLTLFRATRRDVACFALVAEE